MIGAAVSQLVVGPFNDRFGRRGPVLLGLAGFAVVAVLCALVGSVALRLLQGTVSAFVGFLQGLLGVAW